MLMHASVVLNDLLNSYNNLIKLGITILFLFFHTNNCRIEKQYIYIMWMI